MIQKESYPQPTPSNLSVSKAGVPRLSETRPDPYASRTHRRIDLLLLIATVIVLFFVLRASAHGQSVMIGRDRERPEHGNATATEPKPRGRHNNHHQPKPASTPADAQTIWNNASPNWNGNSAWTAGKPNPGDVAAFNAAAVNQPTLGSDVSIAGLYFTGTATGYNISPVGKTLTLTATGTSIGAETGDTTAAAIAQDGTGTPSNTVSTAIILAPSSGSTSTMDIETGTVTLTGPISGSGINLSKTGAGTLVISGAATYSGTTTIIAGTLTLDSAGSTTARLASTTNITVNAGGTLLLANSSGTTSNDRINDAATMTLNGGRFNTGGLSEHGASNNAAGIGALTLSATSIIDMGSGASIIAFADSHLASWTGTLSIYNWSGTPVTGGGTDQLYFGSTSSGLTVGQLAEIQFYSDAGSTFLGAAAILSTGEVVPVPEPATWIAGGLAFLGVACMQRRRIRELAATR